MGVDQSQDLSTAQQLVSFFDSTLCQSGPGYYSVFLGSDDANSGAIWVQGTAQVNVDARGTDPTRSAQLAGAMQTWPSGASG